MKKQLQGDKSADVKKGRNNNFNAIRFVAAMMVIVGHMYPLLGLPSYHIMGQAVSTIAVKMFFLISGYLITESYLRDSNVFRYSARRFFRIIPGLAGVTLFAAFIVGPLVSSLSVRDYFASPGVWSYLTNIGLYINYNLPGVFAGNVYPNAVNGSLWSLPVEVAMYVLLPCFLWMGKRIFKNLRVSVIVAVVVTIAATVVKRQLFADVRVVFYGMNVADGLVLAPYFFIGALFTFSEIKKLLNLQLATGLWLVASFLNLSDFKIELVLYVVLSYSVFAIALAPNPFFGKWFAKNDYSYGIYLYGFLVQQLLIHFMGNAAASYNIYLVISIGATYICAFASWHLIEKPSQKLGKYILGWSSRRFSKKKVIDIGYDVN